MCRKVNDMTERSLQWHREWLPESEIEKISQTEVTTALLRSRKRPIEVKRPEQYRRILAILYFMKQPTKIRRFIESGICDTDLPLCLADDSGRKGVTCTLRSQKESDNASKVRFKKREEAEEFCNRQWTVLAPVFVQSEAEPIPHKSLRKETVLPFRTTLRSDRKGAFGEVSHVEIHPDHYKPAVCCPVNESLSE